MIRRYTSSSGSRKCTSQVATTSLYECLAQLYNPPVDILQLLDRVDGALLIPQHETVVADRLNLQIVVKLHKTEDLLLRSAV